MENKYAHSDFDSFYLEYSPKLWRLAYRLTRNRYDSEDLVDEAFLIYLQKSITMVIDNPEAYITRILANLVRNYARLSLCFKASSTLKFLAYFSRAKEKTVPLSSLEYSAPLAVYFCLRFKNNGI